MEDTLKISKEIMIVPLGYEMKVVWELFAYETYIKVRLSLSFWEFCLLFVT